MSFARKVVQQSLPRLECVACSCREFHTLETLPDFPAYMGCVNSDPREDVRLDMCWGSCSNCGTIQLTQLAPLDLVYLANHNEAVGKTWKAQHQAFAKFIVKHGGNSRLEIGGASGALARLVREIDSAGEWLTIEPNPEGFPELPNTEVHRGWFDGEFVSPRPFDTIIHSHVMEHWYEPRPIVANYSKQLPVGGKVVIAIPRILEMLQKHQTNALNFEHTYFLSENLCHFFHQAEGLELVHKDYYDAHNVFLVYEKQKPNAGSSRGKPAKDEACMQAFQSFVNSNRALVKEIKAQIEKHDGPVYIFGAHIFTLYLLGFGLSEDYFKCVLDNGPNKIGKRLYGTSLITQSPKCLRDVENPLVVLHAGAYNEEIKQDILGNINSRVSFC